MDMSRARPALVGSAIITSLVVALVSLAIRSVWRNRPSAPLSGRCHTLYVVPVWGLANRLRTIRRAYDLACALRCRLVVIETPDSSFKGPWLREMISLRGVLWGTGWIPPGVPIVRPNSKTSSTLRLPLMAFRDLAAQHPAIGIAAASAFVPYGVPEPPAAKIYEGMRLLPVAAAACEPVLKKLREAPGPTIGVHIRHGTPLDYKRNYFFGPWPEHLGNDPERTHVPQACCWADAAKSTDSCPDKFSPMEAFVQAMRKAPKDATFFVCSDRPGCLDVLREEFGSDRVVMSDPAVVGARDSTDNLGALVEWYCLSQCDRILMSLSSSFGREAAFVRGVPCTRPTV